MTPGIEKGWDGNGNSMAVERVCVGLSVNGAAQKERGMRSPVTRGWAECAAAPGAPARPWPIVWTAAAGARGFEGSG